MLKLTRQQIDQLAWDKQSGLIPAIVQHFHTGQVLMLGYMNCEAIELSQESNKVTFFSRSKQRLWTKGESSGNHLELRSISVDCDNDTLLIQAIPVGPTCHTGTQSCWRSNNSHQFLSILQSVIKKRKNSSEQNSYVGQMFGLGSKRIAQKVGEEAVETVIAAMVQDKEELINESADLLFHLMLLLEHETLSLEDTISCLANRHKS